VCSTILVSSSSSWLECTSSTSSDIPFSPLMLISFVHSPPQTKYSSLPWNLAANLSYLMNLLLFSSLDKNAF
jgi:hypothetical protein